MELQRSEPLYQIMVARYYSSSLGRFLAVDPASESINPANPQTWNRYAYVLNNPLVLIDPTGETLTVSGSDPAMKKFQGTANSGLYGKEANVDSNGNVTLEDNGMQGPPSPEQAAFEATLTEAIGDVNNTSLSLVEGSSLTVIDSFTAGEIDMNDVQAFGSGPGASAVGFLAHGVAEQYQRQVQGVSDFFSAHNGWGIAAENDATGYTRGAETGQLVHNARTGDISGKLTVPYTRGSGVVNVTTTVRGGNVTKVDRK